VWRGAAATKALIRIFIIAKISGKLRARFSKLLKIFLRSSQVLSFKSYDFIKIVLGFENRASVFVYYHMTQPAVSAGLRWVLY